MQNYLPACKIVTTHGVRGEMKALPLCDGPAFLGRCKRLFAAPDGSGEVRLLGVRAQGNMLLIKLEGVADMDAARARVGRTYYFACPKGAISSTTCWAAASWTPSPGGTTAR